MHEKHGIHINWKDRRLYIRLPQHPHCNANGYVLLSRLVAENIVGRYLEPRERVHHRDGNSLNNAPENLSIFKGQKEHVQLHNAQRTIATFQEKLRDRNWLFEQYITQYKSTTQIASELRCSDNTVTRYILKHGIPKRRHTMTPAARAVQLKGARAKKPRRTHR
jgi:hypothetical protein